MNNVEIGKGGGRKQNSHLPQYKFKKRIKIKNKNSSKNILLINLEVKLQGVGWKLEKLPQGNSNFEQALKEEKVNLSCQEGQKRQGKKNINNREKAFRLCQEL